MISSESENFNCRTCGACCQGLPLFACNEEQYNRFGMLYEYRGLTAVRRGPYYVFITEPCRHLSYENGMYTCLIQDHKPLLCASDRPGGRTCHEARNFYNNKEIPQGLRIR